MADVAATLAAWSSTTNSNAPSGSTNIGTGLDDCLREIQGVVVRGLSHKGADIASAATTDLGAIEGLAHDITGTTTITSLGTVRAGIWKIVKFEGALTLTHNATSLILPGAANITTADGDVGIFISEGSGNWRCVAYVGKNGHFNTGTFLGLLTARGDLQSQKAADAAARVISASNNGSAHITLYSSINGDNPALIWSPGTRLRIGTGGTDASGFSEKVGFGGSGEVYYPGAGTTASAANAFLDSGSSPANQLLRSTSSIRYKDDIQDVTAEEVSAAMKLRPITYKSKAEADDKNLRLFGFLAEDAHDKQPMLVTYGKDKEGNPLPDGFQYERMTVVLLAKVRELESRLSALEA